MWSLDGEKVMSIARDSATLELAVGKSDGSITLWDTQTWSIKATLQSGAGKSIITLKYATVKMAKTTQTILLVRFFLLAFVTKKIRVPSSMMLSYFYAAKCFHPFLSTSLILKHF